MFTYAARNALLPQLQGFGLALGFVVSGAIIMEIVFSYPGIGLLLVNAVTSNDYPLMQAIFLVITFAVLLANLIVDMVSSLADPRARAREASLMTLAVPVSTEPASVPAATAAASRPLAAAADQGQGGRRPARHLRAGRHHRAVGHALRPVASRTRRSALSLHAPDAAHLLGTTRAARTCCPSCWSASG